MPEVKAFRAWMYKTENPSELDELVSPPYDVISENERQKMLERNPHNSVRLSLKDPEATSPYEDMAETFKVWKKTGVLQQFPKEALYLVEEKYKSQSEEHIRIGFVGLLKTSEFSDKQVLPHEYTLKGPKKDRMELLKTMRAELSQIFFVYDDPQRLIDSIYEEKQASEPLLQATDAAGVARRVWAIDKTEDIQKLCQSFETKPVLIADGHHRYETALEFSRQNSERASQYVQSYFLNAQSPGFQIRPIHRIASLPESMATSDFLERVREEFSIEESSLEQLRKLAANELSRDQIRMGMIVLEPSTKYWILSRKKRSEEDAEIFSLQKDVFERLMGWDISKISEKSVVNYHHEIDGLMELIHKEPAKIGFVLPPTDLTLIRELAERGERMPQKSSFFFPKIASGLIIYDLDSN